MQHESTFSLVKEVTNMNVTKLITRSSAALLMAVSVLALAEDPIAPDYTLHKATVNLTLTTSVGGIIEKETLKTKDAIDLLDGDSDNKNHELTLVVPCGIVGVVEDVDAVALTVFNKDTGEPVVGADFLILDILTAAFELKDGDLRKADLVAEVDALPFVLGDLTIEALLVSGTAKFDKLGKKVTKDEPWSEDARCAKKFNGKSAVGFLETIEGGDDINLMSGKVRGGKVKAGWDGCLWDCVE
jgi:hypothetical protein